MSPLQAIHQKGGAQPGDKQYQYPYDRIAHWQVPLPSCPKGAIGSPSIHSADQLKRFPERSAAAEKPKPALSKKRAGAFRGAGSVSGGDQQQE